MIDYAAALGFAGIVLVSTLKPGPGLVSTVSRALSDGPKHGIAMALGNASMHVVFFILVCLTFTFASDAVVFLTFLLKSLGATFLIYLGIREFIKGGSHLNIKKTAAANDHIELLQNYLSGVAVCAANPLVIFLYAALVPTFLDVKNFDGHVVIVFSLIVFAMNGGGLSTLCVMAGSVRSFFEDSGTLKAIRIICGIIFITLGLIIGLSALPIINWTNIYF